MRSRPACVLVASVLTASAPADVVIQSRSFEIRETLNTPAPHQDLSYDDTTAVNQISPAASAFDVDTPHGNHFTSTVSAARLSATLFGSHAGGDILTFGGDIRESTWFAMAFEITDGPSFMRFAIQRGGIYPYIPHVPSGVSLTVTDFDTGEVVFDLFRDLPPRLGTNGPPGTYSVMWETDGRWSRLLEPGTYVLVAECDPVATAVYRGGLASEGGGELWFLATFAPGTMPALAPAPPTHAILLLLPALSVRRRR